MFDKSRLLIGVGLVVVAGLTYFALSGGSEDPVEPAGAWGGADPGSVTRTADQNSEPDVNLWPAEQDGGVRQADAPRVDPTLADAETTTPAAGPAWPAETGPAPADSYDRATTPAADYSYNAPPITPPANSQNNAAPTYTDPAFAAPLNDGPTSGWPTESSTPAQPTSTNQPVQSWPDAAMAEPSTGAPRDGYQSQAAAYTVSPSATGGYADAPAVRTGRLETGTYPGGSLGAADNPGSQLNGTIEIPRPRANYEYNGSSVY